jgi:hypothetical protein
LNRAITPLETASGAVSSEDLRSLASAKAPCITALLMIPDPRQRSAQISNIVREVEKLLKDARIDGATAASLVEPLRAMAAATEQEGDWSVGFALFRSPDIFRYFLLRDLVTEFVMVGERFQIRPLLPLLSHDQRCYLLALSQKHVRLFRCTNQSEQELQLRRLAPENLHVWLNNRIPDHVLDNRSAGGPSVGSMKGVLFGTNNDRERHDEYLAHFFKKVDKGIHHILRFETAPLIVAGVDSEVSIYRRVNSYPRLLDNTVHGSPDGLMLPELHDRALEIMRHTFSVPLGKVMAEYQDYRDRNRVLFSLDEILIHTQEGRVSDLLLREDAVQRGVWDECSLQVRTGNDHGSSEDLLNLAALLTISHRGQAFALKAHEMPNRADSAALLRF